MSKVHAEGQRGRHGDGTESAMPMTPVRKGTLFRPRPVSRAQRTPIEAISGTAPPAEISS